MGKVLQSKNPAEGRSKRCENAGPALPLNALRTLHYAV